MNRLITLSIIVALLIASAAQGEVSASADPIVIEINGDSSSGQVFTVGETITITCDIVASGSISDYMNAPQYRALALANLKLFNPIASLPVQEDPYNDEVIDDVEASVSVNETLSITYTLKVEGLHTIEAGSSVWLFYSDPPYWRSPDEGGIALANDTLTFEVVDVLPVEIDIKPGSYPNSVNLGSQGVIPVAILSSADFDAITEVDRDTVELAGAGVAVRGKNNKLLAHEEDVNDDGLLDLVCKVDTENLEPGLFQDGYAILTGKTIDGRDIEGMDEITIVPPE
jgi:hypothetical protein